MTDELERLEAELAARAGSAQPVKPATKPDDEAEARRIEREERIQCARLQRRLAQQQMIDSMTLRQAREKLEQREWETGGAIWDAADRAANTKRGRGY